MDLIVWYNRERTQITGFQLCYRKGTEEKAITWREREGYSHTTCDDGEGDTGQYKMTPILIPDGPFDHRSVMELFQKNSENLEQELVGFISNKIKECPQNIEPQ